jgi:hypothetical protein
VKICSIRGFQLDYLSTALLFMKLDCKYLTMWIVFVFIILTRHLEYNLSPIDKESLFLPEFISSEVYITQVSKRRLIDLREEKEVMFSSSKSESQFLQSISLIPNSSEHDEKKQTEKVSIVSKSELETRWWEDCKGKL